MTIAEAYVYFGIRIYMGIHKENRIESYWTKKPFFPFYPISELIGLKRFESIHRRIRLAKDPPKEDDFKSVFDRVSSCRNLKTD